MSINQNFPEVSPSLTLDFANSRRLDPRITFTRSSTATYVGSNGLIKTAPVDEARFDHDPVTGESLGLLIEESRTNNALYSEQVNLWTLSSQVTISSNFAESPIGDQTADKLIPDTTNNFHYPKLVITLSSTSSVTYSIYAKQAGYRYLLVNTPVGSTSGNAGPVVDLQDGVVVDNFTATYPTTVTDAGNGWWRIAFTYTGIVGNLQVDHNLLPTSTVAAYAGDGNSGVLLWGAQLEAGAFPTSYIPTTTSTVTRAADLASIEGTNFSSWYNQSEGTIFTDISPLAATSGRGYLFSNGSNNQRLGQNTSDDTIYALFMSNGSVTSFSVAVSGMPKPIKACLAYKPGSSRGVIDGALKTLSTTNDVPDAINQVGIGFQNYFGSSGFLNGHISRLAYYPQRLTDSQLQNLTK
jgi:hypothetical protein